MCMLCMVIIEGEEKIAFVPLVFAYFLSLKRNLPKLSILVDISGMEALIAIGEEIKVFSPISEGFSRRADIKIKANISLASILGDSLIRAIPIVIAYLILGKLRITFNPAKLLSVLKLALSILRR